jgi:hypothetical protein
MDRMKMWLAIAASTGVALAAGSALAGEPLVTVVKAGPALDAVRVVRDKETGQMRPATAEEIEQMTAARAHAKSLAPSVTILNRPTTTIIDHPDGSSTIRRSVDDLDSLVASRGADGKLSVRHGGHAASNPTAPKE